MLNKPGALDREEWAQMQRHPTEGLLALFGIRGLSEVPYRAMLMAYEHHMKLDLTGYPQNVRTRAADAVQPHRRDGGRLRRGDIEAQLPGAAVAAGRGPARDEGEPGRGYDPVLVKALISVTGVFPVGTLAILDTYELAVVTARNPDPKRCTSRSSGSSPTRRASCWPAGNGRPERNRSVHPAPEAHRHQDDGPRPLRHPGLRLFCLTSILHCRAASPPCARRAAAH
jgi:hypothetical protein